MISPGKDRRSTDASAANIDVDLVVREVMRRLTEDRSGAVLSGRVVEPRTTEETEQAALRIDRPVIAVSDVTERLQPGQTLVVPPGTIVTPAARDVIREAGGSLQRATNARATGSATQLVVATADTAACPIGLIDWLQKRGHTPERLGAATFVEAVDVVVGAVSSGEKLGLLLTDSPAAAACRANRHAAVRAAAVNNREEFEEVKRTIGANLIIVDSQRVGQYAVQQIAVQFIAAGLPTCPERLR